jgi:hypothetical protein
MARATLADVYMSCELLIQHQQFDQIARILSKILSALQDQSERKSLRDFLKGIPENKRIEFLNLALVYSKILSINRNFTELLEFTDQVLKHHALPQAAPVLVERAGGLLELHCYLEARDILVRVIPYLQSETLGVAWVRLGGALFYLDEPWREAFQQARHFLFASELGKALLHEGSLLLEDNQRTEARTTWLEALQPWHFRLA